MARIIALANQKGGVTKTTSTLNIAASLANKNYKVLMVDMDSQASLTISCGLEPLNIENNICSLLKEKPLATRSCITNVEHIENLDIITSIIDLAKLEMQLLSRPAREGILSRALKQIENEYDFIIIDCPPQLSILTMNGLSASDEVIIPVATDYLAYRGLEQLLDTVVEIMTYVKPELKISGVIATLYSRTNDDKNILKALKEEYNVLGVIKRTTKAKQGIYDGKPIVISDPESDVAKEYAEITKMVIADNYIREEV